VLAGLSQWRSLRLRESLALEGEFIWRFGIFRFIYDEEKALPILSNSFYMVCCNDGCHMD